MMDPKVYQPLLSKKGVVAVGRGFKISGGETLRQMSYVCSVEKKLPLSMISEKNLIPTTMFDTPTDVIETGKIKALVDPKLKHRPAMGGISIGHSDVTAGTLGYWVQDLERADSGWAALSNNHVLANVNNAIKEDDIYQPGPYDGGTANDVIALLNRFVEIKFTELPPECPIVNALVVTVNKVASIFFRKHRIKSYKEEIETNLVDCAIASVIDDNDVDLTINGIGKPTGKMVDSALGMKVKKSGRTTGYTEGVVTQIDTIAAVDMGGGKTAVFEDQVMTNGHMSAPGDSGSMVLDENNHFTGLVFAGSDKTTIYNRIQNVMEALNIRFV